MMKKITFLLLLIGMIGIAQTKGNNVFETKTFDISNFETIKIDLHANVIIDQSAPEGMTITMESNLFDLIDKDVTQGTLLLDQKEWIQPSKDPKIIIGAPNLRRVINQTHNTAQIINVNNDFLNVMVLVGGANIKGETQELRLSGEQGKIDASKLVAQNAYVKFWGRGEAKVNVINTLDSDLDKEARITVVNTPKKIKGDTKKAIARANQPLDKAIRYIDIKIKNNSWNRNQFVVVGPKPDGKSFGYGFPMMPGAVKKERWTTGTKIYKVNKVGLRKLLVKIGAKDENQVVKLFE